MQTNVHAIEPGSRHLAPYQERDSEFERQQRARVFQQALAFQDVDNAFGQSDAFRNGSCGNGVGRSYYGAEYQAGTPVESSGGIRSACSAELLWHYRLTRPIAPNAAKSGGPNNSVSFPKPRLRRQHPTVKSPQRKMAQPTD